MTMSTFMPVFYDCEASSVDGFVIEIGWAFVRPESGLVVSASRLVRPATTWPIEATWDENAEALHGVSLRELRQHGRPALEIAQLMNREFAGRELFSDSLHDENWLEQLFDEAGLDPSFMIRRMSADALLEREVANRNFDLARYTAAKQDADRRRTHRAESDALLWATLWQMVTRENQAPIAAKTM